MPDIFTLIVALLAAVGVVSLTWLLLGGLLRSDSCADLPVVAVLRVPERPADVQRAVRRLKWLSQWGALDLRIVLADGGMVEETRKQVEILLRNDPGIAVCSGEEVPWIIRNA